MELLDARIALIENTILPELWKRLHELEKSISLLGEGIMIMAESTIVRQSELEGIKYQVASLAEGLGEIEIRVSKLEKHNSTVSWVLRQLGTIFLVLLSGYLFSVWM